MAIDELLSIGATRKCSKLNKQYISSFFLVPKSDGGQRFVLNLKNINKFNESPHFKMDDIRTVLKLTFKDIYMAKIEILI